MKIQDDPVYRLYRDNPAEGRSSYLHDHYKRGRLHVARPHSKPALAAWMAGRDAADAEDEASGVAQERRQKKAEAKAAREREKRIRAAREAVLEAARRLARDWDEPAKDGLNNSVTLLIEAEGETP